MFYAGSGIDAGDGKGAFGKGPGFIEDHRFRSGKGTLCVCEHGAGVPFCEEKAKEILLEPEIDILVTLGEGSAQATAWGCDLTYDYVKINGDYRT